MNKKSKKRYCSLYKVLLDPKQSPTTQLKINEKFHIPRKKIIITTSTKSKQSLEDSVKLSDNRSTKFSTHKNISPIKLINTKVDSITKELFTIVKGKLEEIRMKRKLLANKKLGLNVRLIQARSNLKLSHKERKKHNGILDSMKYINKKLELNCNELEINIKDINKKISNLKSLSESNLLGLKDRIDIFKKRKDESKYELDKLLRENEEG